MALQRIARWVVSLGFLATAMFLDTSLVVTAMIAFTAGLIVSDDIDEWLRR